MIVLPPSHPWGQLHLIDQEFLPLDPREIRLQKDRAFDRRLLGIENLAPDQTERDSYGQG